jgi:hypothetical protein
MNETNTSVAIQRGQLLRLNDAAGWVIRVSEGRLWITHESEGIDHFVEAGSEFTIRGGGRTVVSALCASIFQVCSGSPMATGDAWNRFSPPRVFSA